MLFLLTYLLFIFVLGNSYRDILHCNKKPFYLKGQEEDSSIMDAYIVHVVCGPLPLLVKYLISFYYFIIFSNCYKNKFWEYVLQLNHIFRTRDIVTKNDSKMAKHQETVKEEILTGDSFLDHGFTRPKVVSISFFNMFNAQIGIAIRIF